MSPGHVSREELVAGLIRAGEREVTGEDEAELDAYFAPGYAFHGPDGAELDYEGLKGYFASMRAAFDDLTITRGIMLVEGRRSLEPSRASSSVHRSALFRRMANGSCSS